VRVPDTTGVQLAILFTPRHGLTPAAPGTVTTPGPSPSATPADGLPPPEIVDLSRWAAVESPPSDRAQT
jgi:hypothetical protein